MDFQTTAINRQRKQRITLDIDVIGDEIDFAKCEQIADSFVAFISQVWWLADPKFEFSCSSKVTVQAPRQKNHQQVQLPNTNGNGRAKQPAKMQPILSQAGVKQ
ncbi:hypothetical protein [Aliterella atlantica]|uniref:Uncharacterized protein n=1 Tax=Aliterella atlantica CENA595 TaxID=1618023 RepID=A0A0D8ZRH2_9CYAN|nr:hypothetical protein [Aliterella atlantica]KJH69791.1 hypothetical protein UH38_22030 [Aliterella atlantica CENA595]